MASDLVEVVRCKDCKYAEHINISVLNGYSSCAWWSCFRNEILLIEDDWFCSHGEAANIPAPVDDYEGEATYGD